MILTYDHAHVEINGQSYDARVSYNETPDGVEVFSVEAFQKVAKAGDYWYDRYGDAHRGPHFLFRDVTEFVDAATYKEEIESYLKNLSEPMRRVWRVRQEEIA